MGSREERLIRELESGGGGGGCEASGLTKIEEVDINDDERLGHV